MYSMLVLISTLLSSSAWAQPDTFTVFRTADYAGERLEELTFSCNLTLVDQAQGAEYTYSFSLAKYLFMNETFRIHLGSRALTHLRSELNSEVIAPNELILVSNPDTLQFSNAAAYYGALMQYLAVTHDPPGVFVDLQIGGVFKGSMAAAFHDPDYTFAIRSWIVDQSGDATVIRDPLARLPSIALPFEVVAETSFLQPFSQSADLVVEGHSLGLKLECVE